MKFKTLFNRYKEWKYGTKPKIKRWNREYADFYFPIFKYFSEWDISRITPAALDTYRQKRIQEGISIGTINKEIRAIHRVFEKGIFWGVIEKDPTRSLRPFKEPKPRIVFLNPVQESALYKAIMEEDYFHRAILLFGFQLGLRIGEILELKWQQVNFSQRIITIKREKSHHFQLFPLTRELFEALKKMPRIYSKEGYIFVNKRTGKPIGNIQKTWRRVREKAGLGFLRFHDLRHHLGTKMVMMGMSPYHVSAFLGHTDIRSSNRYIHGALLNDFRGMVMNTWPGSVAVNTPDLHSGDPRFESWPGHSYPVHYDWGLNPEKFQFPGMTKESDSETPEKNIQFQEER